MNELVYYCKADGGHWNLKVEVLQSFNGLSVIRGLTSELCGSLGNDGHVYDLVRSDELFHEPQADDPLPPVNVIPLR